MPAPSRRFMRVNDGYFARTEIMGFLFFRCGVYGVIKEGFCLFKAPSGGSSRIDICKVMLVDKSRSYAVLETLF